MVCSESIVRCLTYLQVLSLVYRLASAQSNNRATYTTKYDYINVDAVMKNERILKMLVECMLERGRCTREGLELKAAVPDALATDCAKCSQMQRKHASRVIAYLITYKKEYWNALATKYDPDGSYRRKYGIPPQPQELSAGAAIEPSPNLIKPTKTVKKTVTTVNNTNNLFKAKKRMTREEKKEMVRRRFPQLHFMPNMWASNIQKIEKKSERAPSIARRNVRRKAHTPTRRHNTQRAAPKRGQKTG